MFNFKMKKKDFLNELANIFEKKKITETDSLEKLGFDSLKILELIAFQESKFKKVNINPSDYNKCKKVSDLIKLFRIKK